MKLSSLLCGANRHPTDRTYLSKRRAKLALSKESKEIREYVTEANKCESPSQSVSESDEIRATLLLASHNISSILHHIGASDSERAPNAHHWL